MNALITTNADAYRASTDAAALCKQIVVASAQNIGGRKYIKVEGWQAIAIAHGCTASADHVERVEDDGMGGFRALGIVRRMSDGAEISRAEGFLGDDEQTWTKRPVYARRAMVQTRAISRACRSAFAHVVVMMNAGLETTPAEEVPSGGFDNGNVIEHAPDRRVVNPKTGRMVDPMSPNQARQDGRGTRYDVMRHEITDLTAVTDCIAWGLAQKAEIDTFPPAWRDDLRNEMAERIAALRAGLGNDAETGEVTEARYDARGNPVEEAPEDVFPGDWKAREPAEASA